MINFWPGLTLAFLVGPIVAGLIGIVGPTFGYWPYLGMNLSSLNVWNEFWNIPGIYRSIFLSIKIALVSTIIAVSLVILFIAAWYDRPIFKKLQAFISPILSIPHAAAAFGIAFLIAPSGWISRAISPALTGWQTPPDVLILQDPGGNSLILALIAKEIPFLFLMSLAALSQFPHQKRFYLSRSLGKGRIWGWLSANGPDLYHRLRLPIFAVLGYASSTIDMAMILGPTRPPTLAVQILFWVQDPDLSRRALAAMGALIQLGIVAICLLIWIGLEKIIKLIFLYLAGQGVAFHRDKIVCSFAGFFMIFSTCLVFASILVLAIWSIAGLWQYPQFLPEQFQIKLWTSSLNQLADPLMRTFMIAALSSLIAIILTLGCLEAAEQKGIRQASGLFAIVYLPLIIPQITFLLGMQIFFIAFNMDGSLIGVILVHVVFVLPYTLLAMAQSYRQFDPRYMQVAKSMGKSQAQFFFNIRLPMMLPVILTAFAIGFAVSVSQYLPTILIGAGRIDTLTTEALALASGGNRKLISVYALWQTLLPTMIFALSLLLLALIFKNRRGMQAS